MSYAEHWREHVLPRVERLARGEAIAVYHWMLGLTDVRVRTYAEAIDATMVCAIEWGASRLPPAILLDLEVYVAETIDRTIDALTAR